MSAFYNTLYQPKREIHKLLFYTDERYQTEDIQFILINSFDEDFHKVTWTVMDISQRSQTYVETSIGYVCCS